MAANRPNATGAPGGAGGPTLASEHNRTSPPLNLAQSLHAQAAYLVSLQEGERQHEEQVSSIEQELEKTRKEEESYETKSRVATVTKSLSATNHEIQRLSENRNEDMRQLQASKYRGEVVSENNKGAGLLTPGSGPGPQPVPPSGAAGHLKSLSGDYEAQREHLDRYYDSRLKYERIQETHLKRRLAELQLRERARPSVIQRLESELKKARQDLETARAVSRHSADLAQAYLANSALKVPTTNTAGVPQGVIRVPSPVIAQGTAAPEPRFDRVQQKAHGKDGAALAPQRGEGETPNAQKAATLSVNQPIPGAFKRGRPEDDDEEASNDAAADGAGGPRRQSASRQEHEDQQNEDTEDEEDGNNNADVPPKVKSVKRKTSRRKNPLAPTYFGGRTKRSARKAKTEGATAGAVAPSAGRIRLTTGSSYLWTPEEDALLLAQRTARGNDPKQLANCFKEHDPPRYYVRTAGAIAKHLERLDTKKAKDTGASQQNEKK